MLTPEDIQEGMAAVNEAINLAREYQKAREMASNGRYKFEAILTSKVNDLLLKKPNAGFEALCIMLRAEQNEEVEEYYKQWKRYESRYKGLERLISSIDSKVSYLQSCMKYDKQYT